ncbi:hypothetical protein RB600_000950 [Gaeumannomyces tritici]
MDATMDPGMAVDLEEVDLFGDPVAVSLMSATRPPPSKQLLSRLDEMRGRGCCQKIAWSRQGTIASVSADGRSVDLRYLRSHPDDAAWGLSDSTTYSSFGSVAPQTGGGQIAHLAWASSGNPELAVVDDVGRVSFIQCPVSLNRAFTTRTWDADPVDELGAVVGCYWLPLATPGKQQYTALQGPAVREGNGWRYETSYKPAIGPSHPNPSKSAFVCITAGGTLKMFYSQPNNKIQETSLELENIGGSDDLITHASICPDRSSSGLCITLALTSRLLKLVKVAINWGLPPQVDKQNPPNTHPLNPTFKEKRMAVVSWMPLGGPPPGPEPPLDISMAHISLLELLPTTLGPNNQQGFVPPLILAVRSHVSPFSHIVQSVLDVWEIVDDQAQSAQPQALHSAFQQLSSRTGAPAPQPATRLHRLDPIWLDKVAVSIQLLHPGRVICLVFSDGTVQHRDRHTLEVMYASPDLERVSALDGLGFRFADETPCLQAAFSPTSCSFVQVCEDSKVRWNSLRYPAADIGSTTQDAQYYAVVAGLAMSVAAASSHTNYDDILAIGRQFIDKPRFAYDWVMEVARVLKIHIDYSEEAHHDQLVRNHHLQLCLSILHHMGLYGEFRPRSFGGKFGAVALGIRSIVILITIASHTYKADKLVPLDEPDVVDALATGSKWTLDVLSWLAESLFDLADDAKFEALLNPTDWKNVMEYLHSRNNDIALHLLLCSSTRGFIQAACRRLIHLDSLSHRATDYYEKNYTQAPGQDSSAVPSNRLHLSYQRMQRYTSSSLIKVAEFGELLSVLGSEIRSAYEVMLRPLAERQRLQQRQQQQQQQQQGPNGNKTQQQQQQQGGPDQAVKRAQAQCELSLLLGNAPPNGFIPVLKKFFFEVNLPAFRAQTDRAQLFFADFTLLDVLDDRRSLQERRARGKHVDAFKRSEIELAPRDDGAVASATGRQQQPGANGSTGVLLRRRCVRCAAVMEDVTAQKPAVTLVVAQQRKCPCGGSWGLLAKGATAG